MAKIRKIEPIVPTIKKLKRVAAYARVSMESDRLNHSLSQQVSYYSELIQNNPNWEYAGVYTDAFISGTSTKNREAFMRMIDDCEKGMIDIILTKSISRFARNTVDLLQTVRRLKVLGIEVRFEKENINSLSADGELMLTLLACFAEQESVSQSDNIKWSIRKKFEKGVGWGIYAFGYDRDFNVIESEAAAVRKIYDDYLADVPMARTAKWLKDNGYRCTTKQFIKGVLCNNIYMGDLLLQKYFSPKLRQFKKNNGELPKYYVAEHHDAIISRDVYDAVQSKMKKSLEFNKEAHRISGVLCFSAKMTCACCGSHYVSYTRKMWVCYKKLRSKKADCKSKNVSEKKLKAIICEMLGLDSFDENTFTNAVSNILVHPSGDMIFTFYSGRKETRHIEFYDSEKRKYLDPHTKIYGYTYTDDGYIINEEEAKAVRMVCEDYLNNMSISDISRKMESLGYKSKRGKFSRKIVLYILSNPFYKGTRIYPAAYSGTGKEEVVENDHPAIISAEEYEKIRERREIYKERKWKRK